MSSLRTHRHRDDLAGEHKLGDIGQVISAVLFAAVWITDAFMFRYSTLLDNYIPFAVRLPLAIIVLVISAYLVLSGFKILFLEIREKPRVIRKSAFGIVRHPIYISEILLYLGLFLLSTSLAGLAVLVIIIFFLHYISRYEEKALLARFGEEYAQYMKDVPMYFPRFRRKK
jgi:protein-S-isoprenylcysteine O-methyltransferase Ste14